jgi:hypothetical protein
MSTTLEQSANKILSSFPVMIEPAVVKHARPSTQLIKFERDDVFEPVGAANVRPYNDR